MLTNGKVVDGRPAPSMTQWATPSRDMMQWTTPSPAMPQAARLAPSVTQAPLPSTSATQGAQTSPALARAAQNFEALTIAQLLQPIFDTVDTAHGPFGGGDAEAAWKPMLVDAIAKQVAARGGLGFAGPVFHALLRAQETQAGTAAP